MGRFGTTCEDYSWHMAGGTSTVDENITALIKNTPANLVIRNLTAAAVG